MMEAIRRTGYCYSLLFLLVVFSLSLAAQDSDREKEKEESAKKASTKGMVNISGSVRCGKPDPSYSIDVPDRPGHSLIISRRHCTWSEPLVILGAKTKDGVADGFTERMEGSLHTHGFEVDTLDNGEKLTMQTSGQINAEKGPVDARGRWSFMRGTGKFKGIKGGGTYDGKLDADDVLTLRLEGVYDPAAMAAAK
ncbi:MAG: hypothetical protein WAU58_02405 [Terriglobales bacterium]